MSRPIDEVKKEIVLKRFYVEKSSILKIAKEEGISRNTVRNYITSVEPAHVISLITSPQSSPELRQSSILSKQVITKESFKRLQKEVRFTTNELGCILEGRDLVAETVDIANHLGINTTSDLIMLEIAMEHYLSYMFFSHQINALLSTKLDHCWILQTDKLSRTVSRLTEASDKSFKRFNQGIKDLEIKYGKRSPDFGRIHNLNIQKNEINVGHASSGSLQGQVSEA